MRLSRKDKRLEWQVDYFISLLKKIYLEMDVNTNSIEEDKENIEGGKKDAKKGKKRRLQGLHPSEDENQPVQSEAIKAATAQSRVVQYLKV